MPPLLFFFIYIREWIASGVAFYYLKRLGWQMFFLAKKDYQFRGVWKEG